MAAKKRAKKKTTARKRKRSKTTSADTSIFTKLLIVLALGICALGAVYYLGSFALRSKMEHIAIQSINVARSPEWMPRPVITLLNIGYDAIPESEGLVVEGGELGHEDSPLIAGVPQSKSPIRVLHNKSYINLFHEKEQQTVCIAFKLSGNGQYDATVPDDFFEDPRIKQLRAQDMRLGQWMPHSIAPPEALAREFGEVGANEACLVTNLTPMSEAFHSGIWQRLMQEITVNYPSRFGEIWIYIGPVNQAQSSKLDSGVTIPDEFYAIVFDLTEAGGLRAIAFLVPQNAPDTGLHNTITSISKIEKYTGLQFLPDVEYHAQDVLKSSVSPQLW